MSEEGEIDRSKAAWTSMRIAPLFTGTAIWLALFVATVRSSPAHGEALLTTVTSMLAIWLPSMAVVYMAGALPAWIGGYLLPRAVSADRFSWRDLAATATLGAAVAFLSPLIAPAWYLAEGLHDLVTTGSPTSALALAALWAGAGAVGGAGVVLVKLANRRRTPPPSDGRDRGEAETPGPPSQ